jgi:hypothetical protein
MSGFRLTRAADWPPEMHAATDAYERAINAPDSIEARATLKAAEKVYRAQSLALDKKRRPEFYRNAEREKHGQ